MKIFLDDLRQAPDDGWTIVRDFEELKALLYSAINSGENIEEISFDNDLGQDERGNLKPDGYEIIKWLAENHPHLIVGETKTNIHSANPVARKNMEQYLEFCRKHSADLLEGKEAAKNFEFKNLK